MILELENKGDSFGGSLEGPFSNQLLSRPDLTDRRKYFSNEAHARWDEMYVQFRRLTENATDYLAHLKAKKWKSCGNRHFVYKDSLTDYLRNFIAVRAPSFQIEDLLQESRKLSDQRAIKKTIIPHPLEAARQRQKVHSSGKAWRLFEDGGTTELPAKHTRAIRRITRFAQRLGERYRNRQSLQGLPLPGKLITATLWKGLRLCGAVCLNLPYNPSARPSEDIYSRIRMRSRLLIRSFLAGVLPAQEQAPALVSRKRENSPGSISQDQGKEAMRWSS